MQYEQMHDRFSINSVGRSILHSVGQLARRLRLGYIIFDNQILHFPQCDDYSIGFRLVLYCEYLYSVDYQKIGIIWANLFDQVDDTVHLNLRQIRGKKLFPITTFDLWSVRQTSIYPSTFPLELFAIYS